MNNARLDVTNDQNPEASDDLAAMTQEQLESVSGGRHHRHHRHHRHYRSGGFVAAPVVRPAVVRPVVVRPVLVRGY